MLFCHLRRIIFSAGPLLNDQQFTKGFWQQVIHNADPVVRKLIHKMNVDIYKYLVDIKCESIKMSAQDNIAIGDGEWSC